MAQLIRFAIGCARLFPVLLVLTPATALAQVPTGAITGRVTDAQDRSIGGVVVTVQSPALQGVQTTTTTAYGDYAFRFLPPGIHTVTFESPGFAAVRQTRSVAATGSISLDVTMQVAAFNEDVKVVASSSSFTTGVEVSTNVQQDLLNILPTGRTMLAAVNLAPAVHQTGPGGAISIAGAMSFENLYMVNGVQIQDNIRREPLDLFIEDAIQETTIISSGASAEYGRFTGGVVNTITRSGGNRFSGSLRTSFRNDNWRTISPFDESKTDQLIPTYEFTAGGPIFRDRTWFSCGSRARHRCSRCADGDRRHSRAARPARRALRWVDAAYKAGDRHFRELKRDPFFSTLRTDPGFLQILQQMESDVATMRRRVNLDDNPPLPPIQAATTPPRP